MKNTVLQQILSPSEEYSPIPFWFFNDEPDRNKIRKQLEDYVAKGVNGFVLHPRIGIPTNLPYLSEEYFEAVRYIVETAANLQMKVVLYDEAMYPSGSAHGLVVKEHPEYASRGIILREEPGSGEVITRFSDGRYLVRDFTKGTIRGIHFGEDDGEADAPPSADILNPEAVKLFIHLTHDQYYEHLKDYFGSTIIAFFTDEPCALGRRSGAFREWVPGMEAEICEAGGELEELAALFEKKENRTTRIYHKLIKKHLRENFYALLSDWCEEHGIALMGHPEVSDDVEEQLYFQIPGQDLILRRIEPKMGGTKGMDSVQAKLSADIARHLGRRRNANECFGVCNRNNIPWYFTAEDMKWYLDWLGFRGVNLFVPHAFYYTAEGDRGMERPPDVGPNNIWWDHYKMFSDYIKRLSYLMTDSVNYARVAVLCDNNKVPHEEVAALYENQVEFNYLPVGLLSECEITDGVIHIREYAYDVVYDPLGFAAEYETALAQVKIVTEIEEILSAGEVYRAVLASEPCKNLRATHFRKENVDLYLLSNEGDTNISTEITLTNVDKSKIYLVDLWKNRVIRGSDEFPLYLKPCENILVYASDVSVKVDSLPEKKFLGDWTGNFDLREKAGNKAVYEYIYFTDSVEEGAYFTVTGEEMVECYCNNTFVGVSFWNKHRFTIGSVLREGVNRIRLVTTGNAANIYVNANISFGIGGENL